MAKSDSKVSIIHSYLEKNPTATWRVAQSELEKHGIGSGYFSIQKSKWKAGSSPKKSSRGAAKGKAKRTAVVGRPPKRTSEAGLGQAVEFARAVGGIDSAQELLNQLASMQVN